jgi:hypothetical protein
MKKIWNMIRPKTQREWIEYYLSQSTDMVDLERRQRELDRRIGPNWLL